MEKQKCPEIRLKGFSGDWERQRLIEVTTMHARIGWQNLRTSEFLDRGKYLLITGTDFDNGNVDYKTCHYVEKFRYEQDKSIQVRNGSILITKDGTLGKVAYVQDLPMPATLNAGVFNVEIKDTSKVDGLFLFHYLKAPYLMNYVGKRATGGTIQHLNQNILVDFPVVLPLHEEQAKIGQFFQNLDQSIALHEKKLSQTLNFKKIMLEKIFPKHGSQCPEIRIKGFSGDWEQFTIGALTRVCSGARVHKDEWTSSGVPFFRTSDVVSTYKGNENTKAYISFTLFEKLIQSTGRLEKGDLLVTGGGSIGIPYLVPNNEPLYSKDADLIWIKKSPKIDSKFLYTFFATDYFRKFIESISHIGTIAHYTIEQVKATPICLPSLSEQVQIGEFFKQLDETLNLQQQQLQTLKNLKQALLEKMFV